MKTITQAYQPDKKVSTPPIKDGKFIPVRIVYARNRNKSKHFLAPIHDRHEQQQR